MLRMGPLEKGKLLESRSLEDNMQAIPIYTTNILLNQSFSRISVSSIQSTRAKVIHLPRHHRNLRHIIYYTLPSSFSIQYRAVLSSSAATDC